MPAIELNPVNVVNYAKIPKVQIATPRYPLNPAHNTRKGKITIIAKA